MSSSTLQAIYKHRLRSFSPVLLGALAGAFLAGCSLLADRQVVAQVGNQTLTLKQYEQQLGKVGNGIAPPDSVHRRLIVDDWVDRSELVLEALAAKLDTVGEVKRRVGALYQEALGEELYRVDVGSRIKVTDADTKALYARRKESRVVAHILVLSPEDAKIVTDLLAKGTPFEQVANEHSMDRNSAIHGGVVGEVMAGQLPDDVEEAVFKAVEGGVTSPLKAPNGFEIIKVVKINPQTPPPYESQKAELQQMVKQRLEFKLTRAKIEAVKASRKFVIQDADIQSFVRRFAVMARDSGRADPHFTPLEEAAPLARFKGGPYTVGELLGDLHNTPVAYRPDLTDVPPVKQFVEGRCTLRLFALEARDRGLERSPELAVRLRTVRDNLLAQAAVQKIMAAVQAPGDEALAAQYQAHKGEFVNGGQADVMEIVTPSAQDAAEAAREARANMDFAALQRRYSKPNADEARTGGRSIIYFDGTHPELEDSLRMKQPGTVVGPVSGGGRFTVLVVRRVYPPLNSSLEQAREQLRQRALREAQSAALKAHVDELKKRVPPRINHDVMMKAKPAPPSKDGQAGGGANV